MHSLRTFRHVGISVQDIDKQLVFYQDILGLEIYYNKIEKGPFISHILDIPNTEAHIIKLGKNNQIIVELLKFQNSVETNKSLINYGYTHFAITVDNINEILLKGVDIVKEPLTNEDGKFIVCFCKDFEGNYIELVECV